MRYLSTIRKTDVGRPTFQRRGRRWLVANHWGQTLPGDVGKDVYSSEDGKVLQIENDEQRAARERRAYENPRPGLRLCPGCDAWVRGAECPACGADTMKQDAR